MKRTTLFQLIHHVIAHPIVGLSFGRLWAWRLHDWTADRAWPDRFRYGKPDPRRSRRAGLE